MIDSLICTEPIVSDGDLEGVAKMIAGRVHHAMTINRSGAFPAPEIEPKPYQRVVSFLQEAYYSLFPNKYQ